MLSANFKPKKTAAALRGFLATARLSCFSAAMQTTLLTYLHNLNYVVTHLLEKQLLTPKNSPEPEVLDRGYM